MLLTEFFLFIIPQVYNSWKETNYSTQWCYENYIQVLMRLLNSLFSFFVILLIVILLIKANYWLHDFSGILHDSESQLCSRFKVPEVE